MKDGNKSVRPILAGIGAIAIILSGWTILGGKEKSAEDKQASNGNDDQIATPDTTASEISVSANKCRGCGRCVQIDPEHFALDVENRTAIVISTSNLDSESLQLAANNCREGAINIS